MDARQLALVGFISGLIVSSAPSALVRIVDALEGELVVESSPGRGTTVTGRVPARALEAAAR